MECKKITGFQYTNTVSVRLQIINEVNGSYVYCFFHMIRINIPGQIRGFTAS